MKNSIQTFVAICMALLLLPIEALAQQALGGGSKIISPEIHENQTVTFRLRAPKAVKVQVAGDFLSKGVVDLVENKEGVWEYTTSEPLKPELYGYTFIVDGLRMNDPSNVYKQSDDGPFPTKDYHTILLIPYHEVHRLPYINRPVRHQ